MPASSSLFSAGLIADGNGDGLVNELDTEGFSEVAADKVRGGDEDRSSLNRAPFRLPPLIFRLLDPFLISLLLFLPSAQSCPPDFTSAAGGPCVSHSGLSELCSGGNGGSDSGLFHNGDVDGDSQLTIFDLDAIAAYITQIKSFTDCQKYRADGEEKEGGWKEGQAAGLNRKVGLD